MKRPDGAGTGASRLSDCAASAIMSSCAREPVAAGLKVAHEILRALAPSSLVLDLGAARGSFPSEATPACVICVDLESPPEHPDRFVHADAARLPFRDRAFAAVIANHSLEHIGQLPDAVAEVRRLLQPDGAIFISVPDASTLSDRIYRWLGKCGGHVNAFTAEAAVIDLVESVTGQKCRASRVLNSSLSFLNRRVAPRPLPRKIYLLGGGFEWTLFLYSWLSRRIDRWLGTRTAVYGWAFYFGNVEPSDIDRTVWNNVCIRCGAATRSGELRPRPWFTEAFPIVLVYNCPHCGALNRVAEDTD